MTVVRDYREPTNTEDAQETRFIDKLLEGWAKWAISSGINQRPTPAGDLWQIQVIIDPETHILELSDDAFTLVDQKIAGMQKQYPRLGQIIHVEYRSSGTSENKALRIGLNRFGYRQRLHVAQWFLFDKLCAYIKWKDYV